MAANRKNALVLSGGSIKGAFQVGAIQAVLQLGFIPDFIYGISVGALNGSFLCSDAGKQRKSGKTVNWNLIVSDLLSFWRDNVKQPSDLVSEKSWLNAGASALFDHFDGIVDIAPVRKLVKDTIRIEELQSSPVELKIGTVNMNDGTIIYADPSHPDFIEYLIASASIPIMMPMVKVGDHYFTDGGVREIAPLKVAIDNGATDIVAIVCQPEDMTDTHIDTGNILQLVERVFDIMTNAMVDNDVGWVEYFNRYISQNDTVRESDPLSGYRRVNVKVIRPPTPINLDIRKFTSSDIEELIDAGYEAGREVFQVG